MGGGFSGRPARAVVEGEHQAVAEVTPEEPDPNQAGKRCTWLDPSTGWYRSRMMKQRSAAQATCWGTWLRVEVKPKGKDNGKDPA